MPGSEDLIFQGGDSDECEKFVFRVQRWAFEDDKDEDDQWVARFASSCLSGDAVRFYVTLDQDVRKSWERLRQALLARYPASHPNVSTPAAVPRSPPDPIAGDIRTGNIRIVIQGSPEQRYLTHETIGEYGEHDDHGFFKAKKEISRALVVKLRQCTEIQPIRMLNHDSWLGLVWKVPQARRASNPAQRHAALSCFRDQVTGPCGPAFEGPAAWAVWRLDPSSGALNACWYEHEKSQITSVNLNVAVDSQDKETWLFDDLVGLVKRWRGALMEFAPL